MINLIESLNKKFDYKYDFLQLLNIVYDEQLNTCTITFLYPYTHSELQESDKEEISTYLKEIISIEGELKIKFKKSYLDEKLIIEDVINYFNDFKKSLLPYISNENIQVNCVELNVNIKISLNKDVFAMIDEFELKNQIKDYLRKLYIANISITIEENNDTLPEEIEKQNITPTLVKTRRYTVVLEKKLIGGDIIPQPEYIKDNHKPKMSVILSGIISKKSQKTYSLKKGKRAGEERVLYNFNLRDLEGNIDCVYFCPKSHIKDLEALEDNTMILCVGDLKFGINGKLNYYINKLSLASPSSEDVLEIKRQSIEDIIKNHKQVVFPDLLPRSTQSFLFDQKVVYNDFILKNNIVVFDIETTGLDPDTCEITELGAVKIEHGEITERFTSFARPQNPIPLDVQKLTNITNEMVANAPKIEDVIIDFYNWTRGCIISGYNIVGFDLKFVKKIINKLGLPFDNTVIDAFIVAKQANIYPSNYKLATVVKTLGLTLSGAHRAFNDAYATAQVLMELNRKKSKADESNNA